MYCFPQPTAMLICLKLWILLSLKEKFCLFYLRLFRVIILYTNCLTSKLSFFSHLFHMLLWQNSLSLLNFQQFHYCCCLFSQTGKSYNLKFTTLTHSFFPKFFHCINIHLKFTILNIFSVQYSVYSYCWTTITTIHPSLEFFSSLQNWISASIK